MKTVNTLLLLLAAIVLAASSASAESLRGEVHQPEENNVAHHEDEERELLAIPGAGLFEHWDYQGERLFLAAGSLSYYQLLTKRLGNDSVSSFQVYEGFTLIACVHNFSWCYSYKHDVPRLYALNDAFSSFVIIQDSKF